MSERHRVIPFVRSCHKYLRAADLSIAAMNSIKRAVASTSYVLDVSSIGAAGLLALQYGASRVVIRVGADIPSLQSGAQRQLAGGKLVFAGAEEVASLAAERNGFDVVLGPLLADGSAIDLDYGPSLDNVARSFASSNATIVPNSVRYSAQIVEWSDAERLDADVLFKSRNLQARYAIDLDPVLEQLTGAAADISSVPIERLRALSAPIEFSTYNVGQDSVAAFEGEESIGLEVSQRGRADAVVWIQELVHDGITVSRASAYSWVGTRGELEKGDRLEIPIVELLNAIPFSRGDGAQRSRKVKLDTFETTPLVFWLTGISGAGKTTIATGFKQHVEGLGWPITVLDGDELRGGLNADLGFTDADRAENVRRIAEVASLMADMGRIIVVSCISPRQAFRDRAREIVGAERFVEVFIDAPAVVAEARDPKGLYRRARAGKIASFTGVHSGYEAPLCPQIHLDTTKTDVDSAVLILRRFYERTCQSVARAGEAERVL